MRLRVMVIVGTASALLLAGCGSDGDELSEVEFLAEANEICRVGNAEDDAAFEALFPVGAERTEEEAQQTFFDGLVSNLRGQIDDLRDLNGPSDLEDELHTLLDETSEILDRQSAAGLEEFFATDDNPFAGVNTQLEAMRLITCAEG